MPDRLLSEALKRLAAEAAIRFSSLVASGDPIPFDVAEQAGPNSLFHSYLPLTAQYVREREAELRSLPAFGQAREAVEAAGVAASYLEDRGEPVPAEPGERAARMLTIFIASLWDGCTELSLDRARLDNALAVLAAEARGADEAEVLIAPIIGLQMPLARLRLPRGVEVVRAGNVEAPIEAMRSEGMGREAWEPQFLAVAEQDEDAESFEVALRQVRELISVMRLFRRGGVGLGPYAFAPTGEGQWRRVATGAPAPRGGGYRLSEDEAAQLAELASALEARPDPHGTLAWAIARFEMGSERGTALEGLSDHLLALRAVLDGQGPVGASLPMRAAALIADESCERVTARERIERALELERAAMNGAKVEGALELARWIEESVRRVLLGAALGELGTDLSAAADETLIATGLAEGDAEVTVSAADQPLTEADAQVWDETHPPFESIRITTSAETEEGQPKDSFARSEEDNMDEHDTRILEPIPAADEIRITATNWLDEVATGEHTLEWPAGGSDVERRARIDTPRVRALFEVPEDADWEVRELNYDHYNRRAS